MMSEERWGERIRGKGDCICGFPGYSSLSRPLPRTLYRHPFESFANFRLRRRLLHPQHIIQLPLLVKLARLLACGQRASILAVTTGSLDGRGWSGEDKKEEEEEKGEGKKLQKALSRVVGRQ